MIIVGDNLRALVKQYNIVDDNRAFDETSLTLRLGRTVLRIEPDSDSPLSYGSEVPESWIKKERVLDTGYVLPPKSCVLASSCETVNMPLGYMGLIQTKGSLARLFVLVHCCDGQVDPGFTGKITFEICNLADFSIRLFARQKIAQLFLLKTSIRQVKPYQGRYQGADGPTVQKPQL